MKLVENEIIDLGTVAAFHMDHRKTKIPSTYKIEWQLVDKHPPIIHFQPDCGGCTKNIKKVGNKITADFTPGTTGLISKGITVYLDDTNPLFVKNELDNDVLNKEKTKVHLFIKGNYV